MAGPAQMPVDGVVIRQVPGDGLRPMVKAFAGLSHNSIMRSIVVCGD
jgi:hypothetical protein